uniref:NADH-ubiquinone oxidoreductase chain 2 n=1 Tax=Campodea lubbockii TaxID=383858 RepID=Q0ZD05_9HEXA|nr:NADH dehydrogenase subunit 2 [Campodea lubbockii]ABF49575.1 NADH dehydrogenase subunit 2 [Campodea lubbockii]
MNKSFQILTLSILIFSTMISISASSWISAWMGLEMNLLSIIPLLILMKNIRTSESTIKYFITQVLASMIFITFIILLMMKMPNSFYGYFPPYMSNKSSIIIKMGSAPLHFWLPSVMEGLSWPSCLIIMTWQKISPFILLSYIFFLSNLMIIFISASAILGALGGLNQSNLKKLMAFSSINHISWMLLAISMNEITWLIYFLSYCLISTTITLISMMFNISSINQMWNFFNKNLLFKLIILSSLLSLGGLPPFLGFFPKWMIITKLIYSNILLISILVLSSLVTLYFYIRISFPAIMLSSPSSSYFSKKFLSSKMEMLLTFLSLMSLLFIPFLMI